MDNNVLAALLLQKVLINMTDSYSDRVLAFAGIVQACQNAQQIAKTGMVDTEALTTSIHSVFMIEAEHCQDIFNAGDHLHRGLQCTKDLLTLSGDSERNELMRYIIGIIQLERNLHKKPAVLTDVANGIAKAQQQSEHFSMLHTNVLASLAGLYSDTLSKLKPRIMINGEQMHLTNPDNANKIRSCLLAAVRAAVLWRQSGGSRLQLLFSRKRYLTESKRLLNALN